MEYIISESRLNKLMDAYLNSQLEPKKIVEIYPTPNYKKIYWVVNDIVVGEIEGDIFWISSDIFNTFMGIFGLYRDEAKMFIKRYLLENYNINVDVVRPYNFNDRPSQRWYDKYGK